MSANTERMELMAAKQRENALWYEYEERPVPHELYFRGEKISTTLLTEQEAEDYNRQYKEDGISARFVKKRQSTTI